MNDIELKALSPAVRSHFESIHNHEITITEDVVVLQQALKEAKSEDDRLLAARQAHHEKLVELLTARQEALAQAYRLEAGRPAALAQTLMEGTPLSADKEVSAQINELKGFVEAVNLAEPVIRGEIQKMLRRVEWTSGEVSRAEVALRELMDRKRLAEATRRAHA